jgi:hypothetical protein
MGAAFYRSRPATPHFNRLNSMNERIQTMTTNFSKRTLLAGMILSGALGLANIAPALAETSSATQGKSAPGATGDIEQQIQKKSDNLIQEAIDALKETYNALAFLEQGKNKEALDAMARATGKLEIIIARDPKLALAPVEVAVRAQEFAGTADDIKRIVKAARSALSNDNIQEARHLLVPLASEIDIDVINLPMATYPAAIKEAAKLVEKDQITEAKRLLATTLNTLTVQTTIIPIPFLHVEAALKEAERLAEKSGRSSSEEERLADLLKYASKEIERGEALGYGKKDDFKIFQDQIKTLQQKTSGGKSGKGWFDEIKATLGKLFKSAEDAKSDATAKR